MPPILQITKSHQKHTISDP